MQSMIMFFVEYGEKLVLNLPLLVSRQYFATPADIPYVFSALKCHPCLQRAAYSLFIP